MRHAKPGTTRPHPNQLGGMFLGATLCAMFLACALGQPAATGHGDGHTLYPTLPYVTGHIDHVDAQSDNPRYFSLLRISDADRTPWEFTADGWVGVSVGHLKDHQIQGTTVTVWYEELPDGSLLARFVGD